MKAKVVSLALVTAFLSAQAAAEESSPSPATAATIGAVAVEHDLLTNVAIGVSAYTLASIIHEGLGHESGCALGGGVPTGFSLAVAHCNTAGMSPGGLRTLSFAGPAASMLAGTGFATSLLLTPPKDGHLYYFTWLSAMVNLYQGAGYFLVGPWIPAGDMGTAGFLQGVQPRLPAQVGLSALGLGMTIGTLVLGNHLAEPLLGDEPDVRRRRQWSTTWVPYVAGSVLVTGSSLLNREGPGFAASAGIATFAGTLFLAYVPIFFSSDTFYLSRPAGRPALDLPRSPLWIALGTAAAAAAITVFGPGVGSGFDNPHPLVPR